MRLLTQFALALTLFGGAAAAGAATPSLRFQVDGNTLLSREQIAAALSAVHGGANMATVEQAAQRLQLAYRHAGWGTVVVQVPPQTVLHRLVHLRVVEGRISRVRIAGLVVLTPHNVLHALPALRLGRTPNLAALDSELLMVNDDPAKDVRVIFQPGDKPAQVESLIVVHEHPVTQWTVGLNNSGNAASGHLRAYLDYRNANLRDSDSLLALRLQTSPQQPSQASSLSAELRVPLYRRHMFIEWSALASDTSDSPVATPAGALRFTGKGYALGLRAIWLRPLLAREQQQFAIGLNARRYRNDCTLGVFGAAGCGPAAASISVLPLSLGYVLQRPGSGVISLGLVQNLPLGAAGDQAAFDAARPGAPAAYRLLRVDALAQHRFAGARRLDWRLDAQYSRQALVSAEQFGIGGATSVRGYPEMALAGDSGASTSAEFSVPLGRTPVGSTVSGRLRGAVFADAGLVVNQLGTECLPGRARCSIWGTGVGLRLAIGRAALHLDLARAGATAGSTQRGDWLADFDLHLTL